MVPSRLIAGIATAFLWACGPLVTSTSIDPKSLTVSEFAKSAKSLRGQEVGVYGFLMASHPDLMLYPDEMLSVGRGVPRIMVEDVALRAQTDRESDAYGESFLLGALGCTDKYVKVSAIAGLTIPGIYGIVRINEIRTYEDARFSGEGTLCFPAPE